MPWSSRTLCQGRCLGCSAKGFWRSGLGGSALEAANRSRDLALADGRGAATMLRETDAVLRRRPDLGALPAEAEGLRDSLKTMRVQAPGASTLTEAELSLLPDLATHLSFREIGERLHLSRHTVKSHAMAIYRKLNVSSRNAAVERARELGLL